MIRSLADRRNRLILSGAILAIASIPSSFASPPPRVVDAKPDSGAALEALNAEFRGAYRRARTETLARLGPVILVRYDRLILIQGDRREEAVAIPSRFHQLKAVAHVTLAVCAELVTLDEGTVAPDRLDDLRRLRETIAAVLPATEDCGFSPAQRERRDQLVERALAYLDSVVATKRYRRSDLESFARTAAPLVLASAADAAALQIDGYHKQVTAWRRALTPAQWEQLRIVVVGGQMPRRGNVAVQYFAKLLGLPGEGMRLVYAEELSGDEAALGLLGTHLLDRELGKVFFDDPTRMERDLLGDGAAAYLKSREFGPGTAPEARSEASQPGDPR